VKTGKQAVVRYALPNPDPASYRFTIKPTKDQTRFSDCVVLSIPLQEERGEEEGAARAAGTIYTALVALSGITLHALGNGMPLRGGIQVGTATELYPGEVYGAPLLDAYKRESTIAVYPRTVIHPDLFGYLQYLERREPDTDTNKYVLKKAGGCRRLICEAPDDLQPMLHFLSPEVVEAAPEYTVLRLPAYKWVRAQVGRYRQETNLQLAGRYSRLATYFDRYVAETS
jgi:hypothetical protein